MKLTIEELIEEVKDEICCYEELGEKGANQWEKEFLTWAQTNMKGKKNFTIQDESEIFEIADSYYDAVLENNVKGYWKEFQ
ncbi:MAG: hypothetical protein KHZ62_08355 [Clostridiales bacterium]|nr:hypothetical protein [Clostridiales bacterium]